MKVNIAFVGFSLNIKIKKEENGEITITLPSFIKSQIPLDKLKPNQEISISLASLLKGAGGLLEKFKLG